MRTIIASPAAVIHAVRARGEIGIGVGGGVGAVRDGPECVLIQLPVILTTPADSRPIADRARRRGGYCSRTAPPVRPAAVGWRRMQTTVAGTIPLECFLWAESPGFRGGEHRALPCTRTERG